jgi:hypothetical protein
MEQLAVPIMITTERGSPLLQRTASLLLALLDLVGIALRLLRGGVNII